MKTIEQITSQLSVDDAAALNNAIKAMDKSSRKNAFSKGRAMGQDFASEAERVLGNKVADSGTAGRMFMGAGGAGAAGLLLDPMIPLAAGAGALMYSRPMQGLLTNALTNRPQSAQAIAEAMRRTSPLLAPAAGQVGVGLLQ
jgi:hypothetical protein